MVAREVPRHTPHLGLKTLVTIPRCPPVLLSGFKTRVQDLGVLLWFSRSRAPLSLVFNQCKIPLSLTYNDYMLLARDSLEFWSIAEPNFLF